MPSPVIATTELKNWHAFDQQLTFNKVLNYENRLEWGQKRHVTGKGLLATATENRM